MDGLELDNSRLTTCALGLDNSAYSALELDHSILRTCAHELDNFGWCTGVRPLQKWKDECYSLELDNSNE